MKFLGQLLGFLNETDDLIPSSFDKVDNSMSAEMKEKLADLKSRINKLTDFTPPFR